MFSDQQVEAAVRALSDPERFADAERLVSAVAEPDEATRAIRVETLLAEETRMGMLIGVAVGWELARELETTNDQRGD